MGSRRAVQPAAGALLCLGTGYAIVALSDADSETRQRISKRASEIRRQVLLRTLSRRLQPAELSNGAETAIVLPPSTATVEPKGEDPVAVYPRYYVITGPDPHLTSLARERIAARVGLGSWGKPSAGGGAYSALCSERDGTHVDNSERPPLRLGVPYGCTLGSGEFSSLLEQQLLRQPHALLVDHGRGDGVSSAASPPLLEDSGQADTERGLGLEQQGLDQEQQHDRPNTSSTEWDIPVNEVDPYLNLEQERDSPPSAPSTLQTTLPPEAVSTWDSFLLWATSAVLHGPQLDNTALVALESVLTERYPAVVAGDATSSPGDSTSSTIHGTGANYSKTEESLQPASHASSPIPPNPPTNQGGSGFPFVLEIGSPVSQEGEDGERGHAVAETLAEEGARADGSEAGALCGDLARWGWKLASRRLATVIVSSSNPWVLAELQQALQQADTASSEGRSKQYEEDPSGEAVVVRVALPSAAQREQGVLCVAGELGLDRGRLSAADVSAVADLTGGRRDALLAVLKRVQEDSSTGAMTATLSKACRTVVDDQARELATAWDLLHLPRDNGSSAPDGRAAPTTVFSAESSQAGSGAWSSSAGVSSAVGPAEHEAANTAAAAAAAATLRGERSGKSREDWAPLWEAMGMLSVPSVTVGAVAAGATSAASTPFGTAHPAELLEECALDGATLLRLTSEGWLELSPAAPQVSGTILKDTEHCNPVRHQHERRRHLPSITVHTATIPLDSLSRGVDRSLVGAPPLHLAAFRRLVDGHHGNSPPITPPATGRGGQRPGVDVDPGTEDGRNQAAGGYGGNRDLEGGGGGGGGGGGDGWRLQGKSVSNHNEARARAGELERELNDGVHIGHPKTAAAQGPRAAEPSWSRSAGGAGFPLERELERAGFLIEAAVLGRLHEREEAKLLEDGALLSSNWAELGTTHLFVTSGISRARRDLEQDGRGEDVSDGEWAELQLELIRQERAVVARANEMQTRRGRLNSLQRDILDLEKRAALLPLSPLPPPLSPPPLEDPHAFLRDSSLPAGVAASLRVTVGGDNRPFTGFAEEVVMRDAETGVRLRPLRTKHGNSGDGRASSASESRAVESGTGIDGGDGCHGDGESWRGFGIRRLWRWMRGPT